MATPPDSPIEDGLFEIGATRAYKQPTVALEDLCKQTKFTRHEIRVMYRGFKQVSFLFHDVYLPSYVPRTGILKEINRNAILQRV